MGTHYKGTAKEKLALDTFIKLIRSGNSLSSGINLILSKNSLTESQFNVLDALYHLDLARAYIEEDEYELAKENLLLVQKAPRILEDDEKYLQEANELLVEVNEELED